MRAERLTPTVIAEALSADSNTRQGPIYTPFLSSFLRTVTSLEAISNSDVARQSRHAYLMASIATYLSALVLLVRRS